jgi:hypothetical protein
MLKQIIIKILALINLAEGVIHLLVSLISFWGIYDNNIWDWRVMTAPTTDLFLGLTSLLTWFFLKDYCHHHPKIENS